VFTWVLGLAEEWRNAFGEIWNSHGDSY